MKSKRLILVDINQPIIRLAHFKTKIQILTYFLQLQLYKINIFFRRKTKVKKLIYKQFNQILKKKPHFDS